MLSIEREITQESTETIISSSSSEGWRSEGKILFVEAQDCDLGSADNSCHWLGRDSNQTPWLGWKQQPLFFSWPNWIRISLICSPLLIPNGLRFCFNDLGKKNRRAVALQSGFQIQGSQFRSQLKGAPIPWTGPPGGHNEAEAQVGGLLASFSLRGRISLSDFARFSWTHIKHVTCCLAGILLTVLQTYGRVISLQEIVFGVCLDKSKAFSSVRWVLWPPGDQDNIPLAS